MDEAHNVAPPHSDAHLTEKDVEKAALDIAASPKSSSISSAHEQSGYTNEKHGVGATLRKWNGKVESLAGLEARGITRVQPDERHNATIMGYFQMAFLWFSANITANNLAVGFLGPLLFGLGFTDAVLISVFGALVGSLMTAYMSIWGAQSGNRTMASYTLLAVVARYFMGYWPSKICCLLNIVIMVGYGMIDCIIGGQILSAVSGGSLTIIVGIVIVALISWVVAVFGMAIFHTYERLAWIPQLIVLLVLVGTASSKFDTTTQSTGSKSDINSNRLSFFSLTLSVPVSWAAAASDFYVYYPEHTAKWKTFSMTLAGLFLSFAFVNILGVGLATGIATNQDWSDAYAISSGALILAGYNGVGNFGKFCGVVVALGVIANNIPGTYSAALGFQMLGRYPKMLPRWFWTCIVVLIYFVCAIAGRENLFVIFQNFLALMGYWVTTFISVVIEEHLIFRRKSGFDWTAWEDQKHLPIGFAALTAFLIGWAGAIISMYQVYYTGPIAIAAGSTPADLGIWVGCAFTLITYPPLRFLELKFVGR